MKRNWTSQQLDAINSLSGSVLVSAAAGSGKTAVLVERIIKRITDTVNPSSIDRLLVVTFTKAAASEMRQRISAAIEEKIKLEPTNVHLLSQRMLMPSAKICTIDSFCSSLVKENFQKLDISPDFKIADEGQIEINKTNAMDMTFEMLYEQADESFLNLVELLFSGNDDSYLSSVIYDLFTASSSYPFPEKWLDEICSFYENGADIRSSKYAKVILDYIKEVMDYCVSSIHGAIDIINSSKAYEPFYSCFASDLKAFTSIKESADKGDWDLLREKIQAYKPENRARIKKEDKDAKYVEYLIKIRDEVKDIVRKKLAGYMCCSEKEFSEDIKYLSPMVRALCDATKLFYKNFSQLKQEKGLADFSDVSHMALSLLVRLDDSGKAVSTELAKSMALSYDEILIDEYQDTNKAQDMLFASISRNNLFRVGDVKQSIYRFRRAMPEIFISLKESYPLYSSEKQNYPSKVVLKNNFRSRKSVTQAVNFVFSAIMSKNVGDVDYEDEEQLVFSAAYNEREDDSAQLHILREEAIDTQTETKNEYQARYIASLIKKMVADGYKVKSGSGERNANYGDFCILLRAVNGETGVAYTKALKNLGIACYTEVSASFFSAYEVSLVLALLRVIDNPNQDIPLLTVLMSAVYGFTPDDIAQMRIKDRKSNLYSCLMLSKDEQKVAEFLQKLSYYRSLSVSMGVEDFIRMIYDDTSIDVILSSMKNSSQKRANLLLLLSYASAYEQSGYIGLSGFIGFIDRLERNKNDLKGSLGVIGEANVVKIMSIHKSKGLEFPVCIIGNCNKAFNKMDEKGNVVLSGKLGTGIVMRNTETMAQYESVPHTAVKLAIKGDSISEEMRVLYVAMTRAKEKLIMIASAKNIEKKLASLSYKINLESNKVKPFSVYSCSSYLDWLLIAFIRHPDAKQLRKIGGIDEEIVIPADFKLDVIVNDSQHIQQTVTEAETENTADDKLLALLKERCEYRYEYEALSYAVSKRAASQVDENSFDSEYFASSKPAFLYNDGLTAAQKGTATHTFMQYANYEKAAQSVQDEIERITSLGFITQNEAKAINASAVKKFFESDLYRRMEKSKLIMREKKFTVSVPLCQIYPELGDFKGERVLLQGIADCAFLENGKLIVVDYKTDGLKTQEEFIEKYSSQVKTYKTALEQCTDYEVAQTLLYSFKLGKEIDVKF